MQLIKEPISQGDSQKLQRWLNDPAFDIFVRVVESAAFSHECKAAEHLLKSDGAASAEKVLSNDLEQAQRERYVLRVMREYRKEKSFQTAKAVPTISKDL